MRSRSCLWCCDELSAEESKPVEDSHMTDVHLCGCGCCWGRGGKQGRISCHRDIECVKQKLWLERKG